LPQCDSCHRLTEGAIALVFFRDRLLAGVFQWGDCHMSPGTSSDIRVASVPLENVSYETIIPPYSTMRLRKPP